MLYLVVKKCNCLVPLNLDHHNPLLPLLLSAAFNAAEALCGCGISIKAHRPC